MKHLLIVLFIIFNVSVTFAADFSEKNSARKIQL